jgi:hydrogenase maturation protease
VKSKSIVVGLGNDLLGDDAIGLHAARAIKEECAEFADFIECNLHGLALLDILTGYGRAIIIDAIHTGSHKPGTILQFGPDDLRSIPSSSPHYVSLAEVISIARRLELDFPDEIIILAVEIAGPPEIGGRLKKAIADSIPGLADLAKKTLAVWQQNRELSPR